MSDGMAVRKIIERWHGAYGDNDYVHRVTVNIMCHLEREGLVPMGSPITQHIHDNKRREQQQREEYEAEFGGLPIDTDESL